MCPLSIWIACGLWHFARECLNVSPLILQEPMRDPHVAADGFTYEADAIRTWLDRGNDASPVTGQPLAHRELAPNLALGAVIQDYTIRRQQQHQFSS